MNLCGRCNKPTSQPEVCDKCVREMDAIKQAIHREWETGKKANERSKH